MIVIIVAIDLYLHHHLHRHQQIVRHGAALTERLAPSARVTVLGKRPRGRIGVLVERQPGAAAGSRALNGEFPQGACTTPDELRSNTSTRRTYRESGPRGDIADLCTNSRVQTVGCVGAATRARLGA